VQWKHCVPLSNVISTDFALTGHREDSTSFRLSTRAMVRRKKPDAGTSDKVLREMKTRQREWLASLKTGAA